MIISLGEPLTENCRARLITGCGRNATQRATRMSLFDLHKSRALSTTRAASTFHLHTHKAPTQEMCSSFAKF